MLPCSVGPLSIEMIASRKSGPNPCVHVPRWITSTERPSVIFSGIERGRRVQARQRSISAIGPVISLPIPSARDRVRAELSGPAPSSRRRRVTTRTVFRLSATLVSGVPPDSIALMSEAIGPMKAFGIQSVVSVGSCHSPSGSSPRRARIVSTPPSG